MSEILSNRKPASDLSLNEQEQAAVQANAMAQHIDMNPGRIQAILDLIEAALDGAPLVDLQKRFKQHLGQVGPVEFAYAEQLLLSTDLMLSGQEQHLDALIHIFRPSLLLAVVPKMPPGH